MRPPSPEPAAHGLECGRRHGVVVDAACGVAPLDAVLPRRGEAEVRHEFVNLGKRAAADQRDRAARRLIQIHDELLHVAVGTAPPGGLRDIDQRAVDVEEVRPLRPGRGQ